MAQPAMKFPLSRKQLLELYYFMKLTHELDEQLVRLFRQNKIVGGLYSSLGQEATAIGTAYALEPKDWLAPMIRNVGGLLIKGFRPRDIYMQYMARSGAPTGGKDGTSHFGDLKGRHVVSPISMLGDLIPVMTGVAIAGRYLGQKIVSMTWIGDGGTSTGAFHEGMNFAATQHAPFVCVVENNQWAYSTPVARQVPLRNLADRARAYGIPSYTVDGNDVIAVYQTTKEAVERARAGEGPVLVEAKTMRMKGHAQHDPAEYVPKEMFEYWKARDPITLYEAWLTAHKIWDPKAKAEIDSRIDRELKEDLEFAERSPLPAPELAEQGVYCEGCHVIEPEWHRPIEEVMPPRSMVKSEWVVADFGAAGDPEKPPPVAQPAPAAAKTGAPARAMPGDGARAVEDTSPARHPAKRQARAATRSKGRR
ncbi:MAG TPA: thiamine pyrophosphate-dependent dehydrogenase E1 component subunit alpha [Candidatus Acidoferrales bacterium]|nr:thiamine pyrophosphate-dependent dehydrogenase E1 component subunit alpha [Candidatus Acidoferrales bacterium]